MKVLLASPRSFCAGVERAMCPLVAKVHAEARRFARRGDTVVLIGHAGHEEVEGTLGETPERTVLVSTADDVADLVDAVIAALDPVTVTEHETSRETVHFTLPTITR